MIPQAKNTNVGNGEVALRMPLYSAHKKKKMHIIQTTYEVVKKYFVHHVFIIRIVLDQYILFLHLVKSDENTHLIFFIFFYLIQVKYFYYYNYYGLLNHITF